MLGMSLLQQTDVSNYHHGLFAQGCVRHHIGTTIALQGNHYAWKHYLELFLSFEVGENHAKKHKKPFHLPQIVPTIARAMSGLKSFDPLLLVDPTEESFAVNTRTSVQFSHKTTVDIH